MRSDMALFAVDVCAALVMFHFFDKNVFTKNSTY